jgi:prophage regulatory protein
MHLMRLREVCKTFGMGASTVYDHIARGQLPPAVKIGERNGAWPSDEIDLIVAARMAGKTNDEVKELVLRLLAHRRGAFDRVAQGMAQ